MFEKIFNLRTLIAVGVVLAIAAGGLMLWPDVFLGQSKEKEPEIVEVTRLVPQTVVVTQMVEKVVTATLIPPTPLPPQTATPLSPTPTATPDKLMVSPNGLQAWCIPFEAAEIEGLTEQTGAMPEGAVLGTQTEESYNLFTQVKSCTFLYSFNQPVPTGIMFQVFDTAALPFISQPLTPVVNDPTKAFVRLNHLYVVDPPSWEITYIIKVVDPAGEELNSSYLKMRRDWFPGFCAGSTLPDPVTLNCPETGRPPGQ